MKKVNTVRPKNENNFLRLLLSLKLAEYKIAAESFSEIVFFLVQYSFLFEDTEKVLNSCGTEQCQLYALQENRDLGARYLDSKYSTWISTDSALGDYIPQAPINDEAKRHNQNLPGMGGIFNHINCNLYAYAANNPVKYTDPDGECATIAFTIVGAITGGVSALMQGKELGSREFWGGVAGGAASGFAVGLATDLTVATGGTAAIVIAGAIGGVAGSAIESGISGEKIDPLNVLMDGVIGAVSAGVGKSVGAKLAKAFEKKVLMTIGGKNVIETISKETGRLVYAFEKNSDKIIKALVTGGFDKALGLMTDIAQDIINPPSGDKNE